MVRTAQCVGLFENFWQPIQSHPEIFPRTGAFFKAKGLYTHLGNEPVGVRDFFNPFLVDIIFNGKPYIGAQKSDFPGTHRASKNIIRLSSYFLSHISMVIVREGARKVNGCIMTSFLLELRTGIPSSERLVRKYYFRAVFT